MRQLSKSNGLKNPSSMNMSRILVIAISVVAMIFVGARISMAASHGVGICMTGAKIKAQAGQGYEQILEYYYTGAELTGGEGNRELRVGVKSVDVTLTLRPTSAFTVDPLGLTGGNGDSVNIRWVSGIYEVTISNGQIGTGAVPPIVNPGDGRIYVEGWTGWDGSVTGTLKVKGRIEARQSDKDGKLWAVNLINLEDYVPGMLEEPDSWHMEGLKVLAVAARTYAIYKQGSEKHGSGIPMCATGDCQQYHGDWNGPNHRIASEQTAGQVMKYNNEIIIAAYSGYCGGYTKSNAVVWGGTQRAYLVGVPCVCNTSASAPPGSIRGFLVSSKTRQGVTGAAIRAGGKVAATISSGEFYLPDVPAGIHTVYYDAPGYDGQTQVGITVSSNQTTKTPTCILSPPSGTISGRVVSNANQVIPGASVRINALRASVNANGQFAFTMVNNGIYRLIYEAPGYASQEQVISVAGGETKCPTCMLSIPGGVIRGRVLSSANQVIPGSRARINASVAPMNADGSFSFTRVWSGRYTIWYEAPGYDSQTQVINVADGQVANCPTCLLGQGSQIVGRVLNTKGQVIPGTCIRINNSLMPTNPGGEFRFTMVKSGTYTIYYDAPGYTGQQQVVTVNGGQLRCPTVLL